MEDNQTILDYSRMAETALVSYAKLGSEMAFSELYKQTFEGVVNYIYYWLKNMDSEDIAQEAFIKARHHIGEFRGDSSFSTWVKGIARQIVNQNHRKTPKFVPLDENMPFAQESEDVLQSFEKQRLLSSLETFVKTLPKAQREALELHIHKELSYARCSQKTGKKPKTLRKACQRAFRQCRKFYEKALQETKLQEDRR